MQLRMIWYIPDEIAGEEALERLMELGSKGQLYRKGDLEPIAAEAVCWMEEELQPERVLCNAPLDESECGASDSGKNNHMGYSVPEEETDYRDILLITATDRGLDFAKRRHMAAIAYANPQYPKEKRRDAEFVVEGFEEFGMEDIERAYRRFHGLPWEILVTKRCLVREFTMADIQSLFELYDDEEIRKFVEPLYEFDEECDYERAYIDNIYRFYGYGMWLVFHRQTGALIGRAGLEQREFPEGSELEMGYLIAKAYRRQGYATEVCMEILKYARDCLGAGRINCLIHKENAPSIAFAEKLGFSHYGEMETGKAVMLRFVANDDTDLPA